MTAATAGLYAYAITRPCLLDLSATVAVGATGQPRLYTHNDLSLLVSDIEPERLEQLDTEDLEEGSALASMARAHDAVVRAAAAQTATLPLRFGTVVAGTGAAVELLEARADTARELLTLVEGHREWGIRLRREAPQPAPQPRSAPATSGAEYLARRRKAHTDAAQRHESARRSAREAHEALSALARASTSRTPQEPDVVFEAAYLVGADLEDEFLAAADPLGETLAGQGLKLEAVGPWPPYSFARDGLAEVAGD